MVSRNLLFVQVIALAFSTSLFGGLGEEIRIACSINLEQMSLLMRFSQIGSLVSFLMLPFLSKRIGSYSLLITGIFVSSLSLLGMGLSRSLLFFGAFFLLSTLAGYLYGTSNVMVLINLEPQRTKTNIPLMHLTYSIGGMFSGLYIAYLKRSQWYYGYVQMAALYALLALLFLVFRPQQARTWANPKYQSPGSGFSLLKDAQFARFLFFLITANAVEYCAIIYPLAYITEVLGGGARAIGSAIVILHGSIACSRLLVIPLLKQGFAAKRLLLILCLVSATGLLLLSFSSSLGFALLCLSLLGLGIGAVNPVSQVLEITQWPQDLLQLANLRSMGSTLGRMFMPLVVGLILTTFSLSVVFLFLACCMILALLVLLRSSF